VLVEVQTARNLVARFEPWSGRLNSNESVLAMRI